MQHTHTYYNEHMGINMSVSLCVCVGAHLLMSAILQSVQRAREIVQGSLGGRAS